MDELVNRGEWEKAREVQNLVTPLIYRLCSFPSMHGAVKGIISLDGCPMGDPRLPFLPVALDDPEAGRALPRYQESRSRIRKIYKDFKNQSEEDVPACRLHPLFFSEGSGPDGPCLHKYLAAAASI